jgi:hypothetical protein
MKNFFAILVLIALIALCIIQLPKALDKEASFNDQIDISNGLTKSQKAEIMRRTLK